MKIRDALQKEYGGTWKRIVQKHDEYGDGICGLGCGLSIMKNDVAYELVGANADFILLLCEECWQNRDEGDPM